VIDALVTFSIRVGGALLTFAMQAMLARMMVGEAYGGYVVTWTWLVALGGFAALGLAESSVRFIPRYQARARYRDIAGFWRYGFWLVLATSLVFTFAAGLIAYSLPLGQGAATIVFYILLGLPFLAMEHYLEGIARGLGWYRLTSVPVYILRPMMIILACGALVMADVEITLAVAGAVLIASMAVVSAGLAIYMALSIRRLGGRNVTSTPKRRAVWLRASLPLLLVSGFEDLLTYSDVLLIGFMLPHQDAALYFAAARALALANFAYYAIFFVAARNFSIASAGEDRGELQRVMTRTTLVTIVATIASVAATLAVGPWLLAVFGEAFRAGYPVMVILALGLVARSFCGQANELLIVSGGQRPALLLNIAALVFNCVATVVLVPRFGLEGAAAATAFTMAARSVALAIIVRRVYGIAVIGRRG
jgi:O-antigen/teichoic acid export membrane protein